MSEFDPLKVDAYAKHLAEVNEEKMVIATDDILNEQGALLVKKGTAISAQVTERIVKFKLIKPLESSVSIENELDATGLHKELLDWIHSDAAVDKVHTRYDFDGCLRQRCAYYGQFNIIKQKITVLAIQMPRVFKQSVFSAWLATLLAKQMKMDDDEMNCVFMAAITHDFGMLHISPEVLDKKTELKPEEWRQIQAHTVIGQKILEGIPEMPRRVARSVLEHHERCDGTGYPKGLFESELSMQGQIIALCDSVIAVYWNRFRREGRSLRDLIPIIQVNSNAHFYRTYETLVTILRNSELAEDGVVKPEKMSSFITFVLEKNEYLSQWLSVVETTIQTLGFTHEDRKLHAIQNVFILIVTSVRGSGILDEGYIRWLEQVRKEQLQFAYREIEDVSLMVQEIEFHLKRLTRMMNMYATNTKNTKENIEKLIVGLKAIKQVQDNYKPKDPGDYEIK